MFEANNIFKSFKSNFFGGDFQALKGVSFKIRPGRATGFLGANGAGKTTFIKILMGFINADKGHIVTDFTGEFARSEFLKHVGYIPERPYYYQHLKGKEFLDYMGKLSGLVQAEIDLKIESFAERLNIDFALHREIKGYSKGMLQRLGFLSALLHDPKLLVFDEPLAGLDPIGRRDLKDMMIELVAEGKTLFISSHIIPDIEEVCQDVVVLEKGELLFQGSIHELLEKASSDRARICYLAKSGEERTVIVNSNRVNEKLSKVIEEGSLIQYVSRERPRLEDIIYKF